MVKNIEKNYKNVIETQVSVRGARQIDFTNDEGKKIEGISVYIEYSQNENDFNKGKIYGKKTEKIFIPDLDKWDELTCLSAPYDALLQEEYSDRGKKPRLIGIKPINF